MPSKNYILSEKLMVAKKHHDCDACAIFTEADIDEKYLGGFYTQLRQIYRVEGGQILPGSEYRRVVHSVNGKIATYRARLDMEKICEQFDLFDYFKPEWLLKDRG